MSSNTATLNDTALSTPVSDHASALPVEAVLPAGKLDADNYNAEDLDGITESLFGSGNLNYLALQARQTDAMLAVNEVSASATGDNNPASLVAPLLSAHAITGASGDSKPLINAGGNGDEATVHGSGIAAISHMQGTQQASDHNFTGPFFSDSSLSSFPVSGRNGADSSGHSGSDGTSGSDGSDGTNGNNGQDGHNPRDGGHNGGDSDIDLSAHNDLGLPLVDYNLDPIENIVGNIDIGIGETHGPDGAGLALHAIVANIPIVDTTLSPGIPGVTDNVFPVVDMVTSLATPDGLIHDPIGSAGTAADTLLSGAGLPGVSDALAPVSDALAPVTGALSPVTDMVTNLADPGALQEPITAAGTLADNLASATGIDAQAVTGTLSPVTDMIAPAINTVLETANVGELTQDPVGALNDLASSFLSGAISPQLDSSLNGMLPDHLSGASDGSDTDIFLHNDQGLPQVDVNLDPVENIVGDIDIGATAHTEDGASADLNAVVANMPLADTTISPDASSLMANADSIITQASSMTSSADSAINLLSSQSNAADANSAANSSMTDSVTALWPQTDVSGISPDIAGALGSLISGSADAAGALPSPSGNVSEGLGLLSIESDHGVGLASGLHSGHQGGLFG